MYVFKVLYSLIPLCLNREILVIQTLWVLMQFSKVVWVEGSRTESREWFLGRVV